jgi:hypothetical protein
MTASITTLDKRDVPKSLRGDITHFPTPPRQQSVCGNGRSETNFVRHRQTWDSLQTSDHSRNWIIWRRELLPEFNFLRLPEIIDKVRKRTANVDSNDILHTHSRLAVASFCPDATRGRFR